MTGYTAITWICVTTSTPLATTTSTARELARVGAHGTMVAGLIAARDNAHGGRGVAPRASIYSYNLLARDPTTEQILEAMTLNLNVIAVSNNHWGRDDYGLPQPAAPGWETAIRTGVTQGFGGLGISYVTAGGSGAEQTDDSNLDGYANHYGVIAVCAVDYGDTRPAYSEEGANLWVCAPSSGGDNAPQITTTAAGGRYTNEFGGTAAAAPIVSGVVALMRSAKMDLTWRDVKLILAASARRNDPANSGWHAGALVYGSTNGERYMFNHEYGFGVVDAKAAVDLALAWTPVTTPLREFTQASAGEPVSIPDASRGGPGSTVTTSIVVDTNYVDFIEFVEINLDIDHDAFRNLQIDLVAPSGATSRLARQGEGYSQVIPEIFLATETDTPLRESFRMGSARHLGEASLGTWTLHITDGLRQNTGTLESWSLTFYGQGEAPGKPRIDSAATGDTSLDVRWSAPTDTGASAVTSYDLRHIASDAADKSHSNWDSQHRDLVG